MTDQQNQAPRQPVLSVEEQLAQLTEAGLYKAEEGVLSKNDLKKRMRQLKAVLKKRESAQKKAAVTKDKPVNAEDLDPTQYLENRRAQIAKLEESGTTAWPHKFEVSMPVAEFREKYEYLQTGEEVEGGIESVAGRVISKRASGSKLVFLTINNNGHELQIFCEAGSASDYDFAATMKLIHRGDIIGARGVPHRTRRGELSVRPAFVQLLSPCFHMLPKPAQPLRDVETRARKRYLDLIANPASRDTFVKRSQIVSFIRRFFEDNGYLEVETPVLCTVPGGAAARPFITHHNDFNIPMYMRIAPELPLKQLVVGGLDRVFELGRCFRNEGVDTTHNPEFTSIESYGAYLDYNDLMEFVEELLVKLCEKICGSKKITYVNVHGDSVELDFTPPFARIDLTQGVREGVHRDTGGEMDLPREFESDEAREQLDAICTRLNVECDAPRTASRLLDALTEIYVESKITSNPTFVINHPKIQSPLAKPHRDDPQLTERFELHCGGFELCNAYTELNNPIVQAENFARQRKAAAEGDDEAVGGKDTAFVECLEHALPPTGGLGIGIDRLCMILTNQSTIRNVILFPTNKEEQK